MAQTQNVEPLFSKNLFNVELLYAYVQPGVRTAVAVVNFTKVTNLTLSEYSGIAEVYTVHVFSEGKLVSRTPKIGDIIGSGIAGGEYLLDLGMDGSFWASTNVGLETFTIDYMFTDYPILNEPISVSLVRLGWITSQGDNSEIHFSSQETMKNVELVKYQDGFLYNTLLSQEQFSTLEPSKPLSSCTTILLPSPTLTPTTIPTTKPIVSIDFLSNNLLLTAVLSTLGLITIILLFAAYKGRKLNTTG